MKWAGSFTIILVQLTLSRSFQLRTLFSGSTTISWSNHDYWQQQYSSSSLPLSDNGDCNEKIIGPMGASLIAKSNESFKLSELLLLEVNLQVKARRWKSTKVLNFDPSTGSSMLAIDPRFLHRKMWDQNLMPSCLKRFDWIASNMAHGSSAKDLVEVITTVNMDDMIISSERTSTFEACFTLDYCVFGRLEERKYNSKTLISRVAQCISFPAALDPTQASVKFILMETTEGIYLLKQFSELSQAAMERCTSDDLISKWSGRPYQYSSAINPIVASVVIDILHDLTTLSQFKNSTTDNRCIELLDPTCGSGTFLSMAISKGMKVTGYDINEKCVEGTLKNLHFMSMSGEDTCKAANMKIRVGNSSKDTADDILLYDCAVSNLPWGQNTVIQGESVNEGIIKHVYRKLKNGAYAAFISKRNINSEVDEAGFSLIGECTIPPKNFSLPKSSKGARKRDKNMGASNCFITFVIKI